MKEKIVIKLGAKQAKDDSEKEGFEPYELDSAAESLMRAKEIKENKDLIKALKEHANKKWKILSELDIDDSDEIKSIDDIKNKANKKVEKDLSDS